MSDSEREEAIKILSEKAEDSDDPVIKLQYSSGSPLRYMSVADSTDELKDWMGPIGDHSKCPHCKDPDHVPGFCTGVRHICERISASQLQWALALDVTSEKAVICSGCRANMVIDIFRSECSGCSSPDRRDGCSCQTLFTVKCRKCSVQLRKKYPSFGVPKSEFIGFIYGASVGVDKAPVVANKAPAVTKKSSAAVRPVSQDSSDEED